MKHYIHFSGKTPLIVEGDRLTPDRPCEYPFDIETTSVQGLELAQKIARHAYDIGYAEGLEAARKVAEKVKEPMANAPKTCHLCKGAMDGYCFLTVDGEKYPICNDCHKKLNITPYRQSNFIEAMGGITPIPEPSQPADYPEPLDHWECEVCHTEDQSRMDADDPTLCHSCESIARGIGEEYLIENQPDYPPLARPVPMAAIAADQLTAENNALVPMEDDNG